MPAAEDRTVTCGGSKTKANMNPVALLAEHDCNCCGNKGHWLYLAIEDTVHQEDKGSLKAAADGE